MTEENLVSLSNILWLFNGMTNQLYLIGHYNILMTLDNLIFERFYCSILMFVIYANMCTLCKYVYKVKEFIYHS
jgi:hypothetical protein